MLILQELAVNFALVFDPGAQLFVFPSFHVHASSVRKLEINEILEILLPKFIHMVSFLVQCLSFAIFGSIWLCNIASIFLLIFNIAYLFLYIYSDVAIFYDLIKFEFNLFL